MMCLLIYWLYIYCCSVQIPAGEVLWESSYWFSRLVSTLFDWVGMDSLRAENLQLPMEARSSEPFLEIETDWYQNCLWHYYYTNSCVTCQINHRLVSVGPSVQVAQLARPACCWSLHGLPKNNCLIHLLALVDICILGSIYQVKLLKCQQRIIIFQLFSWVLSVQSVNILF